MPKGNPTSEVAVAEVWRLIDEQVGALEAVAAPLGEALGRVLRRDVLADADQPPFDRAAMDGYAFFPAAGPARYRLVGAIKAGETASSVPGPDEAVRIFTGAALPATGMAVLMQEEARVEDGMLAVERRVEPGEQVRRRATEARTGDVLVRAGTRLGPAEVAIAAAVGETRPLVTRWPRVAHATTGDEIVPPEKTPGPGQIRDSNGVLIAALLGATGLPPGCLTQERWGDDATAATERMRAEAFAKAEVVLISGGASVGEHDYAARVLGAAGFELRVRRVNSRPGRPLIFGTNGRRLAFGLPGNPVSHFVCFHLFVHRALARLAGAEPVAWGTARLAVALEEAANARPTYWPAVRGWDAEGRMTVRPLPWCSSGHLAALAGADALFLVPPHTETLPAGAQVDTLPLTTPAPS